MTRPTTVPPRRPAVSLAAIALAAVAALAAGHVAAQKKDDAAYSAADLAGTWTYRSFHNYPERIGDDPGRALALFFAEAAFEFAPASGDSFKGVID
ncbi:hypothetical protein [Jiella avicenniae]|uniref:Uncharacterized protein n=1 Tax=Jiella avicenniae TaxID=2907202 RepID=A0A9X1NYJ0_9HYPH|nr:hypothetical protein [Jiella avicenniae]MCE7028110.1 hypothetical protein [Jiella avicenniae]